MHENVKSHVNVDVLRNFRSSSATMYRDGQMHEFRNENNATLYVCNLSVISSSSNCFALQLLTCELTD